MTPPTPDRPLNKAEVEEVFGILRSQDSILGIRLVERLYATLESSELRLAEAEDECRRLAARLRGADTT